MTVEQRQPRQRDPAFLAFVRAQPCAVCNHPSPSQAAHIRYSDAQRGSINPGVGAKPDDSKVTPLCAKCHLHGPQSQHGMNERVFWERHSLDPFEIAQRLYGEFAAIRSTPPPQVVLIRKRKKNKTPKPSRPIQSRSAWPSRKIQSRGFSR